MDRFNQTKTIAILGIAGNLLLLCLKLLAGISGRSQAMIADGLNSAGDVFASAMTYAGNRIASRPEDKTHPYGHGKAEYIFSMIISFSLLLVAYKVFRNSLESVLEYKSLHFSWLLAGTALFTILLKSFLYLFTRSTGLKDDNLLVLANSEDHRNDIFVTATTLIGITGGALGINWLDGTVGIGISIWIAYTGARIFRLSYRVLMDTDMDKQLKSSIRSVVGAMSEIDHIDDIIAKPAGISYIIILKVSVNGSLTVNESHKIAGTIRSRVRKMKNVKDVIVHINPA